MKPRPLCKGDTIAVIAPSSAPLDPLKLSSGVAHLEKSGYDVRLGRTVYTPYGYLAGTDEERLGELNNFLANPDIRALFCVRGGYGSLRLLPDIDYQSAMRYPKLLVGYSDITALQCALYKHAGWPSLSGPMVAVEWGEIDHVSEQQFWSLARGNTPLSLLGPHGEPLRALHPGDASGPLIGGNLTMLTRLVGTDYLPDLQGAIIFLEEVGEAPYRLDGLLAQLKLSGVLNRLGGIVCGAITEWGPQNDRPTFSPMEVLEYYFRELDIPIATHLVYGHIAPKTTIPIGVKARLVVTDDKATLSLLEPVVA